MNLNDLKNNIDNLSDQELTALLLTVRQSRRTSKKAATPKKEASKKDTAALFKDIGRLSPEEKEELLKRIQGEMT